MRALILAAGRGNRIQSLANGRPKSLLPFLDTTLLGYSLRQLAEQGVEEIVVVVGFERRVMVDYVRENWSGSVEFVFNPLFDSTNVIFSFWLALPYLRDEALYLHADTVFDSKILAKLIAADEGDVILPVDDHPCAEEEMKVKLDGDRVTLVTKQMPAEDADGEFLGLAKLCAGSLPILRERAEELLEDGEMGSFFEAALQKSIDRGELDVRSCDVSGLRWQEVDFEEDYAEAKRLFT
jgi:choline kinase